MNSHIPFDADNDWTLDPYHCNRSNDPLVDKLIGNAYHVVRTVYCNLGNLKRIYDFLNQYGMVLGVQSEAELKAMTVSASYVRLYGFDNTNKRTVTDYLYVEGDRTGVIPDDPTATGSWILVASSTTGGGGDDDDGATPPYIIYTYNQGAALGGETTIPVPAGTVGVPMIVVEGQTNIVGYGFTYDATSLTVTLSKPLETGDEVHLFLTGTPAIPDNSNVTDWVQINWLYNGGYASGGEQVIQIPYTFQSVPAIYKNGDRYYQGLVDKSYTVDADNQRILLTEALATSDRLIVTIGGESKTIIASDRTIQEVARSANVKDNEVIKSTDTTHYLNGMKVIYDEVAQKSYWLPALPNNVYISSVSNGQLTYSPGNIVVDLAPINAGERELWRRTLAEAGLTLVDGSFEEGATVSSATDAVWHIAGAQCYTWGGALPKEVPADSTPDSTGGVATGAWAKYSDSSTIVSSGFYGGTSFPTENNRSLSIGDVIPSGVMFVRVNGNLMMMSSAITSSVTVTSFDQTVINDTYELYPASLFNEVMAGWKIAQNDAQLARLLPKAGNIYIGYSPVKVEGIFMIQGDIRIKPLLPKVIVDSRQFWLRSPRTWNETNQEYDYTPYDIRIVGNFLFDFYRQDATFNPGVGLAMQSAGTLELSGGELQGGWNSNVTMDYGRWSIADNLYSHDCGRGQIQDPDGSNRQGMAIIVGNATEAHIHHIRTRTTWASSVFVDSYRPGRTLNVMIHDVSINGSGGNGLRLQSDDLVTGVGGGQGTAITRVNISNVTIKNCESHGIRANFSNGSVIGVYIEACNAGIAIEGSSDVTYDNIIIRNCSQGILCRFYPVVCTRLRFGNVLISGCTDWAIYFLAGTTNTTVNLGDIEFDGVTIHCLASPAKAVFISCGPNTTATSDITIKNLRVVGAFPDADGKAICQIYNARHIEVDNWNIRGVNGLPSSYLYAQASQSLNINRLVGVQPFGTVARPIECVGVAGHVNIVNCSVPVTMNGILYTSTPASRYEEGNQFYNSAQPQLFPFTNAVQLRGGDVNTLTTTQLANIVATLINDISLGKFVIR